MANVTCIGKSNLGTFPNEVKLGRATYDFAVDGGLTTATYLLFEADSDLLILDGAFHVKTLFASAGNGANVKIGVVSGNTEAILAMTNEDLLLLNTSGVIQNAGKGLRVAKGSYIALVIAGEALTAGKIEVMLEVVPLTV